MNRRDTIALSAGLGGFGCLGSLVILALLVFVVMNSGATCLPVIGPKPTHATYVYEKDNGAVPKGVAVALDKLNREFDLIANPIDQNIENGSGETPAQYRVAVPAAQKAGLPALVYHTPEKVLVIVRDPKTEQDVLDHKP